MDRGESLGSGGQHGHRVHQACRPCASKKLKCTDQKPCKRCQERNLLCDYGPNPESRDHEDSDSAVSELPQTDPLSAVPMALPLPPGILGTESQFERQRDGYAAAPESSSTTAVQARRDTTRPNDFMQDIWGSTLNVPDIGDYIQLEPDPVLEGLDFSFFDSANASMVRSAAPGAELSPLANPASRASPLAAGMEAFRTSEVLTGWEPGSECVHEQEEHNLILPHDFRPEGPPFSFNTTQVAELHLSLATRDRILAMILRTASPKFADHIIGSFPSIEVLKNLIQLAFVHIQEHQVIQCIHLPSFDPNEQRPEVLGAIVAYASVCSPSSTVRKFGYAIQEAVRAAILHIVSVVRITRHTSRS